MHLNPGRPPPGVTLLCCHRVAAVGGSAGVDFVHLPDREMQWAPVPIRHDAGIAAWQPGARRQLELPVHPGRSWKPVQPSRRRIAVGVRPHCRQRELELHRWVRWPARINCPPGPGCPSRTRSPDSASRASPPRRRVACIRPTPGLQQPRHQLVAVCAPAPRRSGRTCRRTCCNNGAPTPVLPGGKTRDAPCRVAPPCTSVGSCDGYITAPCQEACLELFGGRAFAADLDRASDAFRRATPPESCA